MKVLHTEDPPFALGPFDEGGSIFLAGPTPRSKDVPSWRPAALKFLENVKFGGTVIVPERRDKTTKIDYMDQVEWEYAGLENCTVALFWVPRQLETMPAFTTNVEFGRYVGRKNIVYGRPEDAPKTRYLDWLYTKLNRRDPASSLEQTIEQALTIQWFERPW